MFKYFKSDKCKRFWCRFWHSAHKSDKDSKWHCDKCKLEWDYLPEIIYPK